MSLLLLLLSTLLEDTSVHLDQEPTLEFGVAGFYKLEVFKQDADGNEIDGTRRVAAEFPNVITNTGLNMIGKSSTNSPNGYQYMRACGVGSGSTAPSITDTALVSQLGRVVNRFSASSGRNLAVSTAKYAYQRATYRFNPTEGDGNVSEVGIFGGIGDGAGAGQALNASADMFSRALVLDEVGAPTTIVVLPDETLDVTYELRVYMPNGDVTGAITLNGISTAYTLRVSDIDQGPSVNQGGWGSPSPGNPSFLDLTFGARQSVGYGENGAYTGASAAIGPEADFPTGTYCGIGGDATTGSSSISTSAYIDGTYYCQINHRWELGTVGNAINAAAGIGAARIACGCCSFQVGFIPKPVKTADMIWLMSYRVTWSRYVP